MGSKSIQVMLGIVMPEKWLFPIIHMCLISCLNLLRQWFQILHTLQVGHNYVDESGIGFYK